MGELLDALDRTATTADGRRVRDAVTTRHPLQPFDPRNFVPDALGLDRPFSFDPLSLCRRDRRWPDRAPNRVRSSATRCLRCRSADVSLADLHRLLAHPARGFLRQRLAGGRRPAPRTSRADALPVELDQLRGVADRRAVAAERLAGLDPAACIALEQRRGDAAARPARRRDAARGSGRSSTACCAPLSRERALDPEQYDVDVACSTTGPG